LGVGLISRAPDGTLNAPQRSETLPPRNNFLESGDWVKEIIWDATRVDPYLIDSDDEEILQGSTIKSFEKTVSKLDPFNLSNDHLYEQAREAKFRIRQTFGSIEVFHSGPAKALQLPFVCCFMSDLGNS
jgi:hypothetical protein